jgi:hypothetical protein
MKFVRAPQIDHSGERNYTCDAWLVRSQAQCQLAAGRMTHYKNSFQIEIVLRGILHKKSIGGANVVERARPAAALVADAPVFKIGGSKTRGRERSAKMASVIEAVPRSPEAAVNVHHERTRILTSSSCRQPQIQKLVRVRAVRNARIGGRRSQSKNVIRHIFQNA